MQNPLAEEDGAEANYLTEIHGGPGRRIVIESAIGAPPGTPNQRASPAVLRELV